MTLDDQSPGAPDKTIIAPAASYYRMTRYVMCVAFLAMGAWFGYDGFKNWPEGNVKLARINDELDKAQKQKDAATDEAAKANFSDQIKSLSEEQKQYKAHSGTDILIQKLLFFTLPPLGVGLVIWALYRSRGRYMLEGKQLSVPGHPTISLDEIDTMDRKLWDKKGIVHIEYTHGGASGELTLDDFIYDRTPTDEIFEQIEAYLKSTTTSPTSLPPRPPPRKA